MDASFVYMTCASADEAEKIVSALLERGLIACANIMTPHQSFYRWEGKMENTQEVAVIMKTRTALFDQVKDIICTLHSYECPCIVSWPVTAGHEPFLQWIESETASAN